MSTEKLYEIQSKDTDEDVTEWETWSDGNAVDLLHSFVAAVSSEEIDDVNRYWRVRELPAE